MKKKLLSLIMTGALVMAMTACGGNTTAGGNGGSGATGSGELTGTLKLGVIGPLTGGAAIYGNAVVNGAQIAVDEINALGGDFQIELQAQDDEHDAEKSVNAYHQLQDWGVQAIAGTVTTTPCIAVSAEANSDRVFMLTPSASATTVTEGKDNVFQLCVADPNQGSASAQYIFDNKLATKVAIIYNNADAYSTGIYQTFKTKAEELGLEIVSETTFTDDTTDFSVQVGDAQSNGADRVFLPIYYTPASLILKQADSIGYEQQDLPVGMGGDKVLHDLVGLIGGKIRRDDDFQLIGRIIQLHQILQLFANHLFLVMGHDHDGHGRFRVLLFFMLPASIQLIQRQEGQGIAHHGFKDDEHKHAPQDLDRNHLQTLFFPIEFPCSPRTRSWWSRCRRY